jgi:hypothetical protein
VGVPAAAAKRRRRASNASSNSRELQTSFAVVIDA